MIIPTALHFTHQAQLILSSWLASVLWKKDERNSNSNRMVHITSGHWDSWFTHIISLNIYQERFWGRIYCLRLPSLGLQKAKQNPSMKSETPATDFLTDVISKAQRSPVMVAAEISLPLGFPSVCNQKEPLWGVTAMQSTHSAPWVLESCMSVFKINCYYNWICLNFPRIRTYIKLHCCKFSFPLCLAYHGLFCKVSIWFWNYHANVTKMKIHSLKFFSFGEEFSNLM